MQIKQFTSRLCRMLMLMLALLLAPARPWAQNPTVTGQISDEYGEPIIGATVVEKANPANGTITDIDGNFTLRVPAAATLRITHIGYKPVDIKANPRNPLSITLTENREMLDEVVVVGYGEMRRSDLTGSVASISTDAIVKGGNNNAVGAMQGALPGVQIQRSNNKPGGDYSILIRGLNTISGSTAPLIVVDGVPGASLSNINPDDIEKIDILKDASSTAIYGSRATNGVVMVTTRRGSSEKVKVTYNGYVGFRNYTHMPDMMNGDEYVTLAREAARAQNNNVYKDDSKIFTASELKAIEDGNYFDWVDAVAKTAVMTSHSLQASGGSEKAQYAISAGYYFEDGMLKPQDYSRYNLRAVVDLKATSWLKMGLNMYGTHSVRNTGNTDLLRDALRQRPVDHPTDLVTGEEMWNYPNGLYNSLTTQKEEFNKTKVSNFFGNFYIAVTPLNGLEIKTQFSPNLTFNEIGQYRGKYTKANKGQNEATSNYQKNTTTNWVWDNMVTYNRTIGDHRFDVTGVFSMLQNQGENLRGTGNGLSFNSLWYNLQGGSVANSSTSGYTKTNLMSYLARANYSWRGRYMLTASIRYDGSSKLAVGSKWASFPAAAVAWRISEEDFLKPASAWLDNLKLRLSFGQTGNDNVSAYQTQGKISGAQYYSFGSTALVGYLPANLRNFDLGWERTTEYNLGLDFGFFGYRLQGSVEYYNRRTSDLIMNKTVPITLGYTGVTANVGTVRNEGVEISLTSRNIVTRHFTWTTSVNLAFNRNRIVDLQYKEDLSSRGQALQGKKGDFSNLWIIGQPIDLNYNLKTIGVWQLDEAEEAARYGAKPGQFKILDRNNDGKINDEDRFIDGKRTPDWTGGITNTFTYRDFDLSFSGSFQTGAKCRNDFYVAYALENNNQNFNNLRRDYWTPENPTNASAQPSNMGAYRSAGSANKTVSHVMFSSNFFRLNYITLGYSLPRKLLRRAEISDLRFYATCQNLFTISAKNAINPEQLNTSINTTDFMTRNFMFGVNLSF